jgi:chromosome segregation ATPase
VNDAKEVDSYNKQQRNQSQQQSEQNNQRNFLSHKGLDHSMKTFTEKEKEKDRDSLATTTTHTASSDVEVASLKSSLSSANSLISRYEKEIQELSHKIAINEIELKNSKSELEISSVNSSKLKRFENDILTLKKELLSKDEEILSFRSDYRKTENEKDRISKKLEESMIDHQRDLLSLRNDYEVRLKTVENDNKRLTDVLTQKESDIHNLRKQKDDLLSSNKKLNSSSTDSSSPTNDSLSMTLTEKKSKIQTLENEISRLSDTIKDKDKLIEGMNGKLKSLEEENKQLHSDVISLKASSFSSLTTFNEKSKDYEKQIDLLEKEKKALILELKDIEELESKNKSLSNMCDVLNKNNEIKNTEISLLKDQLSSVSSTSSSSSSKNGDLEYEIIQLKARLNQKESEILEKTSALTSLTIDHTKKVVEMEKQYDITLRSKSFDIDHLTLKIQEKENELYKLNNSLMEEQNLKKLMEKERNVLQQEMNENYEMNKQLKDELKKVTNEYNSLKSLLQSEKEEKEKTESSLKSLININKKQEEELQRKQQDIMNLQSSTEKLQLRLSSTSSSSNDSLSHPSISLTSPVPGILKLLDSFSQTDLLLVEPVIPAASVSVENSLLAKKEEEILYLKSKLTSFETSFLTLEQNLVLKDNHLNEQYLMIKSLQQQLSDSLEHSKTFENQIKTLSSSLTDKEKEILHFSFLKEQLQNNITNLTISSQSLESESRTYKNDLLMKENMISLLEMKLTTKEKEMVTIQEDFFKRNTELFNSFKQQLSSSSNASSTSMENSEVLLLKTKYEMEINQLKSENASKQRNLDSLTNDNLSLKSSSSLLQQEKEKLSENFTLQLNKANEELLIKEKKLKSFTEELLQMQKKLDDLQKKKEYNYHSSMTSSSSSVASSCQTDIHSSDIDKWKHALSEKENLPVSVGSSASFPVDVQVGLEKHLSFITKELEERRKEYHRLFQLLQDKFETPKDDGKEGRKEVISVNYPSQSSHLRPETRENRNHKQKVRSSSEDETSEVDIEALSDNDNGNDNDDGLESITQSHVLFSPITPPAATWNSSSLSTYFDFFSTSLKTISKPIITVDENIKNQIKQYLKASTSTSSSSSSLLKAIKKILKKRIENDEKQFLLSLSPLMESFKSFINNGRKEIKQLKSSLLLPISSSSSSSSSSTMTSNKKQIKETINSLTNDMNQLIRFARNLQEFYKNRNELFQNTISLQYQHFISSLSSSSSSSSSSNNSNSSSFLQTLQKSLEVVSIEMKKMMKEASEIKLQLKNNLDFKAISEDDINYNTRLHNQHQQQQQQQQHLQNDGYYGENLFYPRGPQQQQQQHEQQRVNFPGHAGMVRNSTEGMIFPSVDQQYYYQDTDLLQQFQKQQQSLPPPPAPYNPLVTSANRIINHYNTMNSYQQKSAAVHQEINNFKEKQLSSFQEINKHKR